MIITEKFIFAHLPKTGGTFVRQVLMELYGVDQKVLPSNNLKAIAQVLLFTYNHTGRNGRMGILPHPHTPCRLIPFWLRNRTIFSCMRNPFDYYVSQYEFGWWRKDLYLGYYRRRIPDFDELFPAYPELSFEEYLRLDSLAWNPEGQKIFDDPQSIGPFTNFFVRFYFRRPKSVRRRIAADRDYVSSGKYRKRMVPVRFIFTHDLNRQLYDLLRDHGFTEAQAGFVREKGKVLPMGKGRTKDQKWEEYYTTELLELIQEKDRLLFDLFPQFRV